MYRAPPASSVPHPARVVGLPERVFVPATDAEQGSPLQDGALRNLVREADLLLFDGEYTPQQSRGVECGYLVSVVRAGFAENSERYRLRTAQASPSGCLPAEIRPVISKLFKSTTAT